MSNETKRTPTPEDAMSMIRLFEDNAGGLFLVLDDGSPREVYADLEYADAGTADEHAAMIAEGRGLDIHAPPLDDEEWDGVEAGLVAEWVARDRVVGRVDVLGSPGAAASRYLGIEY